MLSGAFHMRKLLNSYGQYIEVLVRPTMFESLWPRILQVLVWFWFCWHCLPACVSAGSGRGARFGVLFLRWRRDSKGLMHGTLTRAINCERNEELASLASATGGQGQGQSCPKNNGGRTTTAFTKTHLKSRTSKFRYGGSTC